MKKIIFILFLFSISNLYSQREYYNWYFGCYDSYSGLPTPNLSFRNMASKPIIALDGKSCNGADHPISISDKEGNFLFAADFQYLYDDMFNIVFNISDEFIKINPILRIDDAPFCINEISDENTHYIFYTYGEENWKGLLPAWMNLDDLGIRIWKYNSKNKQMISTNDFIKIRTACINGIEITLNNNNKGYWILCSKYLTSELIAYRFDSNGFDTLNPIINKFSSELDSLVSIQVKVSPNRKKIAIVFLGKEFDLNNKLLLADFNYSTGEISNIAITNVDYKPKKFYDVKFVIPKSLEFSPNSKKLYLGVEKEYFNFTEKYLVQYNLDSINNKDNVNSFKIIETTDIDLGVEDLELAPNGTIICNDANKKFVSVIENPNENFNKLVFSKIDFNQSKTISYVSTGRRLPKTLSCKYSFLNINHFVDICENEDLILKAPPFYDVPSASYTWEGPNGFYSNDSIPIIKNVNKINEGYYKVKVYNSTDTLRDSSLVTIKEILETKVEQSKEYLCKNDSLVLFTNENYEVVWNDSIISKSFTVYNTGTYTALAIDSSKCALLKTIVINDFLPVLSATQNNFCEGDSATISLDKAYETIVWNTGETTKDIVVKTAGVYSATVTEGECSNTASIEIKVNPLPDFDVKAPNGLLICDGGSVEIEIEADPNISIQWSDNSRVRKRTFNQSGTFTITAKDIKTGCELTKEIVISDMNEIQADILGNRTFCDGESTTLTLNPEGKSYLWNTGETTRSIEVSESGNYSATITSEAGCEITATKEVTKYPLPDFEILGETIICENPVAIYPNKDFTNYEWNTGANSKTITITEAGNYWLRVTDENGCETTNNIEVKQANPELNLSTNNINFGEIIFGSTKTQTITADRDVIITKNTAKFNANINNKNINIIFNPTNIGEYIDTLIVETEGDCKATDTIYITGVCKAEILASVSNATGYPNDNITNKISLELQQQIPLPIDFNYNLTLNINQDAIYITDNTTYSYANGRLVIDIADYLNKSNYQTQIKDIKSRINLARNHENPIKISNFTTDNEFLIPLRKDGNITIYEVCLDSMRLIENYTPANIQTLNRTTIILNTYESGAYKIEISDLTGKVITKQTQTTKNSEQIKYNYELSNGTYIIKITEPGKIQTIKVIFVE